MRVKCVLGKTLLILLVITACIPMFAKPVLAAEKEERNKVRVGYMIYEGYQEGGEGEAKFGAAYEYYQRLKYYTNWEYEYVYGSIGEMFEQLEKGEIDIMAIVTYTEERAEKYFFSKEPHGVEAFFMYVHKDDTSISSGDWSTLNGKTVGVTAGSYQETFYYDWVVENNISCNLVAYEYESDLHKALSNKEVDAIIDIRVLNTDAHSAAMKSIYRYNAEDLYFAVSKSRPDILKALNEAQAKIMETDEYYAYKLMDKYHQGVNSYNIYLSEEEKQYLENKEKITVGYIDSMNPICFYDANTGKMSGVAAVLLQIMEENYGISFETISFQDENSLVSALKEN